MHTAAAAPDDTLTRQRLLSWSWSRRIGCRHADHDRDLAGGARGPGRAGRRLRDAPGPAAAPQRGDGLGANGGPAAIPGLAVRRNAAPDADPVRAAGWTGVRADHPGGGQEVVAG